MNILSIETSCDESAISLMRFDETRAQVECTILSNALYSQASKHAEYGGVYPNLAKREHAKNLVPLLQKVLKNQSSESKKLEVSNSKAQEIKQILEREEVLYNILYNTLNSTPVPAVDAITVTVGPGLEPALWVGISFAKALSVAWNIPIVPVNHMEGHVLSVLVPDDLDLTPPTKFSTRALETPALALLVSGGHTEIVSITGSEKEFEYKKLGQTRDDAVGEAFDKVARMLDIGYPGGPAISALAEKVRKNNPEAQDKWDLPRPMTGSNDLDFSFSGLKTAVMYKLREHGNLTDEEKATLAREFEDAAIDVLIEKTKKALEMKSPRTLLIGGGVAANQLLRQRLTNLAADKNTELLLPHPKLTGDNAIMIGLAGYFTYLKTKSTATTMNPTEQLRAQGRLSITDKEILAT